MAMAVSCEINQYRMITLTRIRLHSTGDVLTRSCAMFDVRTKQWTRLPNLPDCDMDWGAMANREYMYVIGGNNRTVSVKTVYRLSLNTYEWTIMAPMGTPRELCAAALIGDYIYVFGGSDNIDPLSSADRYFIIDNIWEPLPSMLDSRDGHCGVALGSDIYILGGDNARYLEVLNTLLQGWKRENLATMPISRSYTATVALKDRYLVVLSGEEESLRGDVAAHCFIYDCCLNCWS